MTRGSIVNSIAPIRICDIGGWTDTWFARRGNVFNIGVSPHVEVQVEVLPGTDEPQVVLDVADFGDRYAIRPGELLSGRHPLLEATVEAVGVPPRTSIGVHVHSDAPPGCSTGTSAAVVVALIGALDALTPGRMTRRAIARLAHRIETERLGLQSGIQDQLSAAFGGANFIEMTQYPEAKVQRIRVADRVWWELNRRLVLVYLGRSHVSSSVHEKVIADLSRDGQDDPRLAELRAAAIEAHDSLRRGDLGALGAAMVSNTRAQRALHPDLVSAAAETAFDVAREHGAIGWKVNGAGGDGGSVTLLCGERAAEKVAMTEALEAVDPSLRIIPTHLSRGGLRVWEISPPDPALSAPICE